MRITRRYARIGTIALLAVALVVLALGLAGEIGGAEASEGKAAASSLKSLSGQPVDRGTLRAQQEPEPGEGAPSSKVPSQAPSEVQVSDDTSALLVRFAPALSADAQRQALQEAGLTEVRTLDRLGICVAQRAEPPSTVDGATFYREALRRLRSLPTVVWAEPDQHLTSSLVPNDPIYQYQWGPEAVGLPSAWNVTTGSSSVTIAVVDTGLDLIADFDGRVSRAYSVFYHSSEQEAWRDIEGHGTACAGFAAAAGNDGRGMAGAAWKVQIMPVHISDTEDSFASDAAAGFVYAVDNGADIINLSSGSEEESRTLTEAVDYAVSRGVVVVASAGNSGAGSGIQYPAACPGVIAVGATSSDGSRSSFSNTGDELDLVAPGESVAGYVYEGDGTWSFDYLDGTSFSAPLVAGVAGLMLSRNGSLTADRVASILADTADDLGAPGWDEYYGDGLLDADEAVAAAADRISPVVRFTQPPNGALMKGDAPFSITVSDNIGISRVEVYLDGQIGFTSMPRAPHFYDANAGGPALYSRHGPAHRRRVPLRWFPGWKQSRHQCARLRRRREPGSRPGDSHRG